ncbi:DNA-binding protein [Staphylococcus equorum]|uniref:SAP domain-containing protein n=1 Tax=Staphylococcus equorum TaxID=246432 RepID=UPI0008FB5DBF|nr:SAP domain-containing protein [Staphylococcus equorum]OIS50170.1 DNA-binding protein [Staphylococcus equorum]
MNLNANDLLILHKIVTRTVDEGPYYSSYLEDNNIDIQKSIDKLIDKKILVKDNTLEINLNKIKNTKLSELLKNAGLKVAGNKNELVSRIIDNIDNVKASNEVFELPLVYTATEKGNQLLHETKYIPHFENNDISLPLAHKIAKNYISSSSEDKVIAIYNYEIKRLYELNPYNYDLQRTYEALGNYYFRQKSDSENAILYYHLSYSININETFEDLKSSSYFYYDLEGNFEKDRLKRKLTSYSYYEMLEIYNQLIFIDELSNERIHNLFVEDISNYYPLDEELSKKLIDYLIAVIKKDNENEQLAFAKILEFIEDNGIIDKKEVEEHYNYINTLEYSEEDEVEDGVTFRTSLNKLIDKNLDVEVEIDVDSGELFLFLGENDVKVLVEEELEN